MAQPPSGGCVLKPVTVLVFFIAACPAAFGRLCVETVNFTIDLCFFRPAAFGRLCVETSILHRGLSDRMPAAFGRLCVETMYKGVSVDMIRPSRLRAAVC